MESVNYNDSLVEYCILSIRKTYQAFKSIVVTLGECNSCEIHYYKKVGDSLKSHEFAYGYYDYINHTIHINLYNILKYCKSIGAPDYFVVNECIHTVIHELSHIDQFVDYNRVYNEDYEYSEFIEEANVYNTYRIIAENVVLAMACGYTFDARWTAYLNKYKWQKSFYVKRGGY